METPNINMDKAISQYLKNKERSLQYNKEHPEKCRERQLRNYHKTKTENPEKHQAMLDRKKAKYLQKKLAQK
jgi:hypothetical protein